MFTIEWGGGKENRSNFTYWSAQVLPGWARTSSLTHRPSIKCCNKLINYTKIYECRHCRNSFKKIFLFARMTITLIKQHHHLIYLFYSCLQTHRKIVLNTYIDPENAGCTSVGELQLYHPALMSPSPRLYSEKILYF